VLRSSGRASSYNDKELLTTNKGKGPVFLWDLECTNLNANFGYILCAGVKELGKKGVKLFSVADYPGYKKDPTNDEKLVKDVRDYLSDAGAFITWYGQRFDVPFLNTRLTAYSLKPLPPVPHIDGWRIAREKLKLHSNRLASVSSFLDIEEKTPLNGPIWIKASAGDPSALKYVIKHCKQDVLVLEQAFERIRQLATSGPNIGIIQGKNVSACPRCGEEGQLQSRGTRTTVSQVYPRFQCQSCGAWSHGKPMKVKGLMAN